MIERTFVDKNGNSWTWEETPEVLETLKQLHKVVEEKSKDNKRKS